MSKKLFSRLFVFLLVVGLLFAVAPTKQAQAAALDVCPSGCTYSTIQAAVVASAAGDVINVAAGTYDIGTLVIPHPLSIIGAGDTTLVNGKFQLTNAGSVAGTYLFQTMKFPVTNSSITVTDFDHVIDEVKVDNVTFDTNLDKSARAIGVGVDSVDYRIKKFTVLNSRFYSTLAIYLDGDIGEMLIQGNQFHVTDTHWSAYNAINFNQSKPASGSVNPSGVYTIQNNQVFVPGDTYSYAGAITNQAYPGSFLAGKPGGKELTETGNTLKVGDGAPITDQSLFIKDSIAVANATLKVHNVTKETWYPTIQGAIDATSTVAGDIIEVSAGIYPEAVNVNKSVTITGTGEIETFTDPTVVNDWYTDRYEPEVFVVDTFLGESVLKHGVVAADFQTDTFYNYQGKKFDITTTGPEQTWSIDLFVDPAWKTGKANAGFWATGYAIDGTISAYPIVAWRSGGTDPAGFYSFDYINGGWLQLFVASDDDYGKWHNFAMTYTVGTGVEYFVDGVSRLTFADPDTVKLSNIILNIYNFGEDYNVYWDNFAAHDTKVIGQMSINASDVAIEGLILSNPGQTYGMLIDDLASNIDITENIFEDIGSPTLSQNVKGVYLQYGPDDVLIQDNLFQRIHANTNSVNAIFSGDTNSTSPAETLKIQDNRFLNITSQTKGGYGILLNNGAGNPGAIIEGNSFNGISGGWTHAIGLEGPTPGALVNRNTFSGLTAAGADNTAVFFEANSGLATTSITNNQFLNAGFGVAVHPSMGTHPTVLASPNWWGQLTGPATEQLPPSGDYDYTPWCANAECTAFLPVDLGMDPVTNTAPICNTDTEIIIAVKIGSVVDFSGYTIKVNFDTTKAQVLDVYNGDVLPAGGIEWAKDLGNSTGQLILNYATVGAPISDADGGNLVYIKLKPLAVGEVVFTLDAASQLTGTDDQILFPYTIDPLTSTLTVCGLVAENFNWTTGDTGNAGWLAGISAGFRLEEATFDGATSLVVQLKDSLGNVLQRDTAVISKFATITQITAPFDMYGNFNYTLDGYWVNERFGDYGTTTQPACAVATAVLANGKTVTAENCNLTGDESTIELSLAAEDFAYMDFSNVLGVTAGFHPVNFSMDQATSLKVELFTGAGTTESPYVLLQTNTSPHPADHGTVPLQAFSGPFDIFGSFNYTNDTAPSGQPYWNNVRQAEYGQTAIPTRVLATVVMPGGLEITAENTNLTGDRSIIILGELTAGPLVWSNYQVSPTLGWLRGVSADFELTNNTFTGATALEVKLYTAGKAQLLQTATAADLSKFAGMTWITAPFDIFGHFDYASDGYWTVVKESEYGQSPTVVPDCVVATATLFNGKVVTAERCGFTYGDREDILPGTLTAQDFGYMDFSGVLGVSAGFLIGDDVTMADAQSLVVELYAGTTLLQTNTAYVGPTSGWGTAAQISGPFDIFGGITYGTSYWSNLRQSPEYGQTLEPTRVFATLTLKNGKVLTAENTMLTGDRDTILPDITGFVEMQGRPGFYAGVPVRLTAGTVIYDTTSIGLSDLNFIFDAVEGYTYTFTTIQPRYLNVTADLLKTFLADKSKTLADLRLRAGNAVWEDNVINTLDAGKVGTDWNKYFSVDLLDSCGDVNFDGYVNIQDLALVGGNYELTNAQAYGTWAP